MRIIILLLTSMLSISCQGAEPKILSPKEKIVILPFTEMLTVTTKYDTIKDLNSFLELTNLWIIGAENGIYLMDNQTKRIYKYFKFDIKAHQELFDGQDSIVGFASTDFVCNKTKDKLLVITSNGIVFQIDLKNQSVEWLIKFIDRIETATYSDNGKSIAVGTRYNYKSKKGRIITEFYSSLFLINSQTGEFVDYFNEYASIKKILFKDQDTKLLVAYDWNYTDSYLWDLNKKDKSIAQFREENLLYDIAIISNNDFITVNARGISKWDINKPKEKVIVYNNSNSGSERIIENKISPGFIFSGGPYLAAREHLIFFNKQFNITDSLSLPLSFEDIQYSNDDSVIILENLYDKDETRKGFHYFNIATKELTLKVDRNKLNEIIKSN